MLSRTRRSRTLLLLSRGRVEPPKGKTSHDSDQQYRRDDSHPESHFDRLFEQSEGDVSDSGEDREKDQAGRQRSGPAQIEE
jgi:hypothetical protein